MDRRSLPRFFLLVFTLSAPFWLFGAATGLQIVPGLPIGALMVIAPVSAAAILTYREDGVAGTRQLLARALDYRKIRPTFWYVPVLFLMPGVMVLSYWLMRWMGAPLPNPRFAVLGGLVVLVVAFVAAVGEEVGWTAYATDRLQGRWSALAAGLVLGLVWAAWHLVPLAQAHRAPAWIGWWCLATVAKRVLYVWIYNNTAKSVFSAILFHAVDNVSWQMFPNSGSHYDPRVTGPIVAVTAAIVTLGWGPRTLARDRSKSPP